MQISRRDFLASTASVAVLSVFGIAPSRHAYTAGREFIVRSRYTNTGPTTLTVNHFGTKDIVLNHGLRDGQEFAVTYDPSDGKFHANRC